MKPRPLPTLRIPQRRHPAVVLVRRELARLGLYGTLAVAAAAALALPAIDRALAQVHTTARAEALASFNNGWRERLSTDQDIIRPVCNAWWFGMTTKERKVK